MASRCVLQESVSEQLFLLTSWAEGADICVRSTETSTSSFQVLVRIGVQMCDPGLLSVERDAGVKEVQKALGELCV